MRIKLLILAVALLFIFNTDSKAQSGYGYLQMSVALDFPESKTASIAYGQYVRNNGMWDIAVEYRRIDRLRSELNELQSIQATEEFSVGFAYYPSIVRTKNTSLNLRFGALVGTDLEVFLPGINGGLHLQQALNHSISLFLQGRGEVTFFSVRPWSVTAVAGVNFTL